MESLFDFLKENHKFSAIQLHSQPNIQPSSSPPPHDYASQWSASVAYKSFYYRAAVFNAAAIMVKVVLCYYIEMIPEFINHFTSAGHFEKIETKSNRLPFLVP